MHCAECRCEFTADWLRRCPCCGTRLVPERPRGFPIPATTLSYDELVERAAAGQHGMLRIPLTTTEVSKRKLSSFPYQGYGFAWAKHIEGARDGICAQLATTAVGMERKLGFPWRGYGYGWMQTVEGHVGGHRATLTADSVRNDTWSCFPYFGYGFAWTDAMSGTCGDRLEARLVVAAHEKGRSWGFPWRGYGFAWVTEATLVLKPTP